MLYRLTAVSLIFSVFGAQAPMAAPTNTAVYQAQEPAAPSMRSDSVTVAPGTVVPLTLLSPVKSKSTKPGDSVRAVVAFPVTVGTQLAIPAGTYVEGIVNSVTVKAKQTHMPGVQIHFTRMLFANGYTVALDAASTEAMATLPDEGSQINYEIADARNGTPFLGNGFASPAQTTPEPPPLPSVGPNPAVIGGAIGGGFAVLTVLMIALAHHGAKKADYLLFDNGWQFQMVLQSPLTLDTNKVAAAAAAPKS
ncbi:MAG: hypothetical protein ABSB60_02360 [Terracidiphilus sp.]